MVNYTYITSKDYISQVDFAYLETYSFSRGDGFDNAQKGIQYLINPNGLIQPSARLHKKLPYDNPLTYELVQILKTDIENRPAFMCAPYYRDGIIFYNNNGQIVSVLNVCLSCCYMQTDENTYINGDFLTYDLLKKFFLQMEHDVEEPTHFWMDEFEKLKAKRQR